MSLPGSRLRVPLQTSGFLRDQQKALGSGILLEGCDAGGAPCVLFKGGKVPLVPRTETIAVGSLGNVTEMRSVTLYDVPHHGPILPRITSDHQVEPLGSAELSVRYTGYEPAQLNMRRLYELNTFGRSALPAMLGNDSASERATRAAAARN